MKSINDTQDPTPTSTPQHSIRYNHQHGSNVHHRRSSGWLPHRTSTPSTATRERCSAPCSAQLDRSQTEIWKNSADSIIACNHHSQRACRRCYLEHGRFQGPESYIQSTNQCRELRRGEVHQVGLYRGYEQDRV